MEEDKGNYAGLFSQSNANDKKRANPMANPLESIDEFKRQRDEDSEGIRKRMRDRMFKLRRRFEDELPELNIPEASSEIASAAKEPMEDQAGKLTLADLPVILQEFFSTDQQVCFSGLIKIRKLLTAEEPTPIQELLDAGALPRLLELLKCIYKSQMQLEAAWCVVNIAAGKESHVKAIVDQNGIDLLIGVIH
eukprot:TRINITY_DN1519_c0_g2_i5.p2 TRINITY_DN1519_c0_g2~~TRINITY_DN1519_c0_g2_i5.p2  ORF type:complete len:193 (+),score=32.56 TRINITY_DN1519_c0_g2_i5:64-642(+)